MKNYNFSTDYIELYRLIKAGHKIVILYTKKIYPIKPNFIPTFENEGKKVTWVEYFEHLQHYDTDGIIFGDAEIKSILTNSLNEFNGKTREEGAFDIFCKRCLENELEFIPPN